MPRGVAAEVVLEGVEEEAAKKVEEACREVGVNLEDAVKVGLEAGDAAEVVPKMSMKMASNSRPINLGEAITEEVGAEVAKETKNNRKKQQLQQLQKTEEGTIDSGLFM